MIKQRFQLDFQWPTFEPFLFCVHHDDRYPKGTSQFGPESHLLQGRNIGQDFTEKDGFRMYHGDVVPGFPVHPHRGFETITIVRKGFIDHADSLGAAGRYGEGDVQWMTAGSGVQHSEMFPLLRQDAQNPVELFQIWLNLPKVNKMAKPHFTMHWNEKIPQLQLDEGRVNLTLIAGEFGNQKALNPPPESWANQKQNQVAIYLVKMQAQGKIELPAISEDTTRTIYFFSGDQLSLNQTALTRNFGYTIRAEEVAIFEAQGSVEFLVLQAKPIGEPTVQYGPFVMNTKTEIAQAFQDYQATQFGGWPWPRQDMVHGEKLERFAKYPDGKIEKPTV